jgi:guanylate kinase
MNSDIINEKLKTVKFKGASWEVEFEPSISAIQRLKLQAEAHNEENVFQVRTENGNLVVFFGDAASHAGSFVFQANITGKLKHTWAWPVTQVRSILNLGGKVTMKIADAGAMQITVDSGIAEYNYILPAQSK